eukprot:scaffold239603_cov30-Tisochrysis_lutea.AAC.4
MEAAVWVALLAGETQTLMSFQTDAVDGETRAAETSSSIFGGSEERRGSAWEPAVIDARTRV